MKRCSYLQGVSFIGLNELSLNCLRLINRAAGRTLVTSPSAPVPRPGRDPVFLCVLPAEKVTSLGKDWHRPCLRCQKCKKTLSAGSHAEVRQHHICSPGSCSRASRGVCESVDRTPLPRQQTPRVPLLVSGTESCMSSCFLLPASCCIAVFAETCFVASLQLANFTITEKETNIFTHTHTHRLGRVNLNVIHLLHSSENTQPGSGSVGAGPRPRPRPQGPPHPAVARPVPSEPRVAQLVTTVLLSPGSNYQKY